MHICHLIPLGVFGDVNADLFPSQSFDVETHLVAWRLAQYEMVCLRSDCQAPLAAQLVYHQSESGADCDYFVSDFLCLEDNDFAVQLWGQYDQPAQTQVVNDFLSHVYDFSPWVQSSLPPV